MIGTLYILCVEMCNGRRKRVCITTVWRLATLIITFRYVCDRRAAHTLTESESTHKRIWFNSNVHHRPVNATTKCFKWWFHLQFGLQFCFVCFQHIYIFVCFFNCIFFYTGDCFFFLFHRNHLFPFCVHWTINANLFDCLKPRIDTSPSSFFPLVIWWPYLYNTTNDCLWLVAKTVNKSLEHLRYIALHSVHSKQNPSYRMKSIVLSFYIYHNRAPSHTRMVWFHQRPVKVYNCHRNEV